MEDEASLELCSELENSELDCSKLDCSELDNKLDISELDGNEATNGHRLCCDDAISGQSQPEQSRVAHWIRPMPSHTRSQNGHESGQGSLQPGQVIVRRS